MEPLHAMSGVRSVAVLGNHPPRRCGIATFTADLADAITIARPSLRTIVLAMNDPGQRYAHPSRVGFEVEEAELESYRSAAAYLDAEGVDVLSVQHEYGIFGGNAGSHLLSLLHRVRVPIVTTLHTILAEPSDAQREVMDALMPISERVVVMSANGASMLREVHRVPERKIDLVPHGIPSLGAPSRGREQLDLGNRQVILTFGLLSPDKGIENVVEAMPAILERCPNAIYLVVGATHPHVRERQGETYRRALEAQARRLGVGARVVFHDRFVAQSELADFLAAADVYVTPYLKPEQITSGTLAYAVGLGKAVVSTPYWYAREMLADDRGVLVPWKDPPAIARAVVELLQNDEKRLAFGARARDYGRNMSWPTVGRRYIETFERARADHLERRRSTQRAKVIGRRATAIPPPVLEHVRRMTDSTGILQHAVFDVPRRSEGYCLDDNARALLLTTDEPFDDGDASVVRELGARYLAFVQHAFDAPSGRFHNFMSYARQWIETTGSEDSHGRALWALGALAARSTDRSRKIVARKLFHAALPALDAFTSPRAWAFTLLGIEAYFEAFRGEREVRVMRDRLVARLVDCFHASSAPEWPWFENSVTYDNARLSQALIVSGASMGDEVVTSIGLRSLAWLHAAQRTADGCFAPIGNAGFWVRGATKPPFDQQPVEAHAMVSACLAAARVSNDARWTERARNTFQWFLGHNVVQRAVYDASTGGCRDGLHAGGVNENQGAESTLSFLLARAEIAAADRVTLEHPAAQEITA